MIPPVLLVGAGKMGGAMYAGWCAAGLAPSVLIDPHAPAGIGRPQDRLVASLDLVPRGFSPAIAVLAVKPQVAGEMMAPLGRALPSDAAMLSILAGKTLAWLGVSLGTQNPIVRAMPNLPAAIGQGMTVAVADGRVLPAQKDLCDRLLASVGEVAWLDDEALIDRVTSVSGCGPAYVFLLAELLQSTAIEQGIPPDLALRLARRTVAGAGAMLGASDQAPEALRRAVTSAKGVTEQALIVLMEEQAWPRAIREALAAAVRRAGELAA